jgi:hypothetical protein
LLHTSACDVRTYSAYEQYVNSVWLRFFFSRHITSVGQAVAGLDFVSVSSHSPPPLLFRLLPYPASAPAPSTVALRRRQQEEARRPPTCSVAGLASSPTRPLRPLPPPWLYASGSKKKPAGRRPVPWQAVISPPLNSSACCRRAFTGTPLSLDFS